MCSPISQNAINKDVENQKRTRYVAFLQTLYTSSLFTETTPNEAGKDKILHFVQDDTGTFSETHIARDL